jgi:3-oxoacyl-[acyl-carrier-protein] synthase-3
VLLVGAETCRAAGLERPHDLRAVRRRRRRGGAAGAEGEGTSADRGVLNTKLYSDGRLHDLLYVDGGPSSTQTTGHLRMQGKEVFRHAVTNIAAAIVASAARRRASKVRHRLVRAAPGQPAHPRRHRPQAAHPPAKVVSTVAMHGNTSAASVPLALATAVRGRPDQAGDLVLLEAMGGGFTWGAGLVRW